MPDVPSPAPDRAAVATALQTLDRDALASARWFGAKGRTIDVIALHEAFLLDPANPHVLAIADLTLDDGTRDRYSLALTGTPLREAVPGDGAWRALAIAMAEGRTIAAMPRPTKPAATATPPTSTPPATPATPGPVTAALVCRPAVAMPPVEELGTERDLGADQSNTGVVIGEHVLLKAYRRLQPGLNPDLEMTAFLSEEAGFSAVPPLAGFAELIEAANGGTATTIAMAQQFVADGADAFETIAEALAGWVALPGEVSLEVATEIAADLGSLTAGLHAALADGRGLPDMTPRDATRAELRAWSATARANLERALDVAPGDAGDTLTALAPAIAEALTVLDALPTTPGLQRSHGDYHLGQVLIAPDGFRVIDFEGEPLSAPADRRALRHPLRDVASMLRSLDHVARSAARRAAARADARDDAQVDARDGPPVDPDHVGLDIDAWIERARERFLQAYRDGLREARVWIDTDDDLLRAFEVDKELYEFAYAATYLPSWLYAPTEGMRALVGGPSR
jgi:maltose alpha-D-glucosyltransferase/alpha-amylase